MAISLHEDGKLITAIKYRSLHLKSLIPLFFLLVFLPSQPVDMRLSKFMSQNVSSKNLKGFRQYFFFWSRIW